MQKEKPSKRSACCTQRTKQKTLSVKQIVFFISFSNGHINLLASASLPLTAAQQWCLSLVYVVHFIQLNVLQKEYRYDFQLHL